jgi:hypothetical protein
MFERFRRSHASQTEEGSVATLEPEPVERDDRARFDREPVTERADMASSGTTTTATTLDRDSARDDLGRDEAAGEPGRDEAAREETAREDPARTDVAAFHDDGTGTRDVAGEPTMLQDRERERTVEPGVAAGATGATVTHDRALDRDRDGIDVGLVRHDPVLAPAALDTMRARQRDRFGGIQWGSDFFGWLCAIGLASLLTAALVGAGVALGLSTNDASNTGTAQQIGIGGGIALLCVLAVAWFCGGYVAGRMARFDGARQGVGVWLWTLLAAIVVAAVAAIGGSEYDIFQRLNLPRIAIGDNTLNAGGAIAGAAAVVVTLLFAIIGGKMGERFHRRVDRVATDEYVVER